MIIIYDYRLYSYNKRKKENFSLEIFYLNKYTIENKELVNKAWFILPVICS